MDIKHKLESDGFVVFENYLPVPFIEEVKKFCYELQSNQSEEEKHAHKSLGSLLKATHHPLFQKFSFSEHLIQAIQNVSKDFYIHQGIVFWKPQFSPPTFWHQDYPFWNDPAAQSEKATYITALIYTVPTTIETGALRVVPGTQKYLHPVLKHWIFKNDHERIEFRKEIRSAKNVSHPLYQDLPEAKAISVNPGDLILMDSRLLHGAYGNNIAEDRPLLSIWYVVNDSLLQKGQLKRAAEEVQEDIQSWKDSVPSHLSQHILNADFFVEQQSIPAGTIPFPWTQT